MSATEKKPAVMTVTERRELRRIIKNRFELLQAQLAQRENEIANEIRAEIIEKHKAAVKAAEQEVKKQEAKLRKVSDEVINAVRALRSEEIEPASGWNEHRLERATIELPRAWQPRNLASQVRTRLDAMKASAGYQKLNLKHMELELDEELAIGALGSADAREFLDKIPTVDELLPLPKGATKKALGDGSA